LRLKIRIQPLAEQDVREAYRWYTERAEGLGDKFLASLDACLARIAQNPASCQLVHGQVRRALLRKFPICVYYVLTDVEVVVIAVLHGRRDPARWRSRI
jgi:plasmid stabilization system protein ParE